MVVDCLIYVKVYIVDMSFMISECIESGSSTLCTYTQNTPLLQDSFTLVLGLAIIISIMMTSLVRYVFYR